MAWHEATLCFCLCPIEHVAERCANLQVIMYSVRIVLIKHESNYPYGLQGRVAAKIAYWYNMEAYMRWMKSLEIQMILNC